MRKMKRLLALLLCGVMALSAAACNNNGSQSSSSAPSSGSASTASTGGEESSDGDGDWFAGRDFSEHYEYTYASIQVYDGADYNGGDPFIDWIAEKFNMSYDVTALTWDNWAERLRVWINADDMPDWCIWNYIHGEAANYVNQGLLKELPEDWKEAYPSLAKAAGDVALNDMIAETLGGYYFLLRPVFSLNRPTQDKLSAHTTYWVRTDLADQVNVEIKDAMKASELLAYGDAVVDAGLAKYSFAARTQSMASLVQFNSTYCGVAGTSYYLGEDGQYHWGPADQETLTGLKVWSDGYNNGNIHPEFYTLVEPDDQALFYTTGDSAMAMMNGMVSTYSLRQNDFSQRGLDIREVVKPVVVLGEDGVYHGAVNDNYWAANIFSPYMEDEKFDRLLQMIDWTCTEEAQNLIRLGFEGEDWERNADGTIKVLTDPTTLMKSAQNPDNKYLTFPIWGNCMILSDDFSFVNPQYPAEDQKLIKKMYQMRSDLSTDQSLPAASDINVLFHSSQALNMASMVYYEEYANLVVKGGDIEANWQSWVNEKMPLIQPVLDELNAKLS
jgi:putative aldouronate transport system substrate-binding protein